MMLVGRDEETAALNALFRECAQGRGLIAIIRGPVASGKTALLQAFAEQAVAAGAIFLSAVASRAERGLPLSILDQLFHGSLLPAAMVPQVAELMESRTLISTSSEPEPETVSPVLARVFEMLLTLLVELSADRPVVIAVDDMQYADVVSLQCLSYLARRAGTSRILTVLTDCSHALPSDRLLHAEILRQGNCHSIPLGPLPPSSVARLLAEHVDAETAEQLASACHVMTGGNRLVGQASSRTGIPFGGCCLPAQTRAHDRGARSDCRGPRRGRDAQPTRRTARHQSGFSCAGR
jgi:predicted ATPase